MKKHPFTAALALLIALMANAMWASTVQAADTSIHVVTGVKSGEFLNMRSGAGTSNAVVGRIPHNGQDIVPTGEEKIVSGTTWAKIYWHGVGGWVSKRYLIPEGQAGSAAPTTPSKPSVPPKATPPKGNAQGPVLGCVGTEPFWSITITATNLGVNMADGPQYNVPVTFRQTSANDTRIAVIAGATGGNVTQAFMQKVDSCSDGMSDVSYPYAMTAVLNNKQVISGCCKVQ